MARVLKLPRRFLGHAPEGGATLFQFYVERARQLAGRLLNRIGIPGAIRNTRFKDAITGDEIDIQVGEFFTRLSVNGRDYYFRRISGKFDGSGKARD